MAGRGELFVGSSIHGDQGPSFLPVVGGVRVGSAPGGLGTPRSLIVLCNQSLSAGRVADAVGAAVILGAVLRVEAGAGLICRVWGRV